MTDLGAYARLKVYAHLMRLAEFLEAHRDSPILKDVLGFQPSADIIEDYIERLRAVAEKVKEGKVQIYELAPGEIMHLYDYRGYRVANEHDSEGVIKLTDNKGVVAWSTPRLEKGGAILLGRIFDDNEDSHVIGYFALNPDGTPHRFRELDREYIPSPISRVHAILLPHPDKENHVLWIHTGKNPPKKMKSYHTVA